MPRRKPHRQKQPKRGRSLPRTNRSRFARAQETGLHKQLGKRERRAA